MTHHHHWMGACEARRDEAQQALTAEYKATQQLQCCHLNLAIPWRSSVCRAKVPSLQQPQVPSASWLSVN